jgi:hypothetical protein
MTPKCQTGEDVLSWKLVSYPFVIVNNKIYLNHNDIYLQLSWHFSINIHRDEIHGIKKGDTMFLLNLFCMEESNFHAYGELTIHEQTFSDLSNQIYILCFVPYIFHSWSVCLGPGKWEVMHMCASGVNFASISYFEIGFWNCSDNVVFFILHFILSTSIKLLIELR